MERWNREGPGIRLETSKRYDAARLCFARARARARLDNGARRLPWRTTKLIAEHRRASWMKLHAVIHELVEPVSSVIDDGSRAHAVPPRCFSAWQRQSKRPTRFRSTCRGFIGTLNLGATLRRALPLPPSRRNYIKRDTTRAAAPRREIADRGSGAMTRLARQAEPLQACRLILPLIPLPPPRNCSGRVCTYARTLVARRG